MAAAVVAASGSRAGGEQPLRSVSRQAPRSYPLQGKVARFKRSLDDAALAPVSTLCCALVPLARRQAEWWVAVGHLPLPCDAEFEAAQLVFPTLAIQAHARLDARQVGVVVLSVLAGDLLHLQDAQLHVTRGTAPRAGWPAQIV